MEVNKYTFPVRKDNWRRLFPELFEIRIHDNDIQKLAMALGRTRSVQELVVSTLLPRTLTVLTLRHKNVSYSKYAAVWCNSLRNFWPKFLWVSLRNVHETKFDIPLVNGFRDTVRWLFFNHASVRWWECYARRLKSTFSFLLLDEIQHHLLYIKIGNSKDSRGPTSVSQNRKSLIQYYLFNLIRGKPCVMEMRRLSLLPSTPTAVDLWTLPTWSRHPTCERKNFSRELGARRIRAADAVGVPGVRHDDMLETASATQWPHRCLMMAFIVGFPKNIQILYNYNP